MTSAVSRSVSATDYLLRLIAAAHSAETPVRSSRTLLYGPVAGHMLSGPLACRRGITARILARIIRGSTKFDLTQQQRGFQARAGELARGAITARAAGYSRNRPLERMVRDAQVFTIGGGTAQILRTVVASRLLAGHLPQTRDGYLKAMSQK